MTKAVDAVPTEVMNKFLNQARKRNQFWGDMFTLCNAFGLRNIECRELKAEHVDLNKGVLTLSDSKQVRAYITKNANKAVDAQWLIEGRKWLRANIDDPMVSLIVRLPTDTAQLDNLAQEYDLLEAFTEARESHYSASIDEARALAHKTAPKGRVIDFSRMNQAKKILTQRVERYGDLCGWLFPANELNSNRANEFKPVSRQAVYRVVSAIREQLESMGGMFKRALDGVRLGLHSCRKAAVQRVADTMGDVLAASMWIGHGNGAGDLSTTQNYLNKSVKRMNEINDRLAEIAEV